MSRQRLTCPKKHPVSSFSFSSVVLHSCSAPLSHLILSYCSFAIMLPGFFFQHKNVPHLFLIVLIDCCHCSEERRVASLFQGHISLKCCSLLLSTLEIELGILYPMDAFVNGWEGLLHRDFASNRLFPCGRHSLGIRYIEGFTSSLGSPTVPFTV